ncbi:putative signal peptide protein [Pandoraea cepalis]|uniref:Putative signal peptide protein n=1 Tax=Pandoraea cepalis TaxID=2508294 RepID=A0A5E4VAW4_9BURK|nr:putative signal peptide protein [Pandoraea cepalis]
MPSTLVSVSRLASSLRSSALRVARRRYALAGALCLLSLPVLADVTLQRGPPPPRFEDHHAAPHGQFWVPGYWQWTDGRYDWVDGHMEPKRPGMRYTPPHWEQTGRHEWTLRDGAWAATGWGPGTIHEIRAPQ